MKRLLPVLVAFVVGLAVGHLFTTRAGGDLPTVRSIRVLQPTPGTDRPFAHHTLTVIRRTEDGEDTFEADQGPERVSPWQLVLSGHGRSVTLIARPE